MTLWFSDGRGVSVSSQMYDVAPKVEVGVLSFTKASMDPDSCSIAFPKPGTPRSITLTPALRVRDVWKLAITEFGVQCDSGVEITFEDGSHLTLLPADFPYSLVLAGEHVFPSPHRSEYSITQYRKERVS